MPLARSSRLPPARPHGPGYPLRRRVPLTAAAATVGAAGHGVAGDGRTDDWPALQALVDRVAGEGGGIVELPAGHFILSQPVRLGDLVSIVGQGPASVVRNVKQDGNTAMRACFAFGWFHPYLVHYSERKARWVDRTERFGLSDVARDDTAVRFSSPADAGRWKAGDVFWIASPDTMEQEVFGVRHRLYIRNTLCVVEAADPGSGRLHLDAPVGWSGRAVAVAIPSAIDASDNQPYGFVRNASVLNLRCEGHAAVANTGAVNCALDVEVDTHHGFWTNAWAGGTVRLAGRFASRAVEAKYGSSRLDISVSLTRREGAADNHLVSFGEYNHDCTLRDFDIAAPGWSEALQAIQIQACTNAHVRNGRIAVPDSRSTLVQLYGDAGLRQVGTLIENVAFSGGPSSCLNIGGTAHRAPLPPTGAIRGCTFETMPRGAEGQFAAHISRAQAVELSGNRFSHGYLELLNEAWNCRIVDNRLPGPILGVGKKNTVISGNRTPDGRPLS